MEIAAKKSARDLVQEYKTLLYQTANAFVLKAESIDPESKEDCIKIFGDASPENITQANILEMYNSSPHKGFGEEYENIYGYMKFKITKIRGKING